MAANVTARAYPSKAIIARVLDAYHEAGHRIGGVEVAPDGTIRVLSEASAPKRSASAYEDWKAGKARKA